MLERIGKAHEATGEQVALAFLMARGHNVIPSSGKKDRIIANFAARHLVLDAQDIKDIEALDKGMRLVNGPWCPVWDV
ncbi:aldo/keto reductase [Devosia sp. J2-20]|uniref:aldo/keto reductase n=1 Tax=Devosia sp. J2-20 TaxID=3026161 RepID=UPI00249B225A|nr:aldo/keto reductase [Devosia sp. J2-20]WDQ99960.1 aldo/keto reductase [Devosia sp. J2-20]